MHGRSPTANPALVPELPFSAHFPGCTTGSADVTKHIILYRKVVLRSVLIDKEFDPATMPLSQLMLG